MLLGRALPTPSLNCAHAPHHHTGSTGAACVCTGGGAHLSLSMAPSAYQPAAPHQHHTSKDCARTSTKEEGDAGHGSICAPHLLHPAPSLALPRPLPMLLLMRAQPAERLLPTALPSCPQRFQACRCTHCLCTHRLAASTSAPAASIGAPAASPQPALCALHVHTAGEQGGLSSTPPTAHSLQGSGPPCYRV